MKDRRTRGSILVGAVVLAFALTILGVAYLSFASSLTAFVYHDISSAQSRYDCVSGAAQGIHDWRAGRISYLGPREFYSNNYIDYDLLQAGQNSAKYGYSEHLRIIGKGISRHGSTETKSEILYIAQDGLSFADFEYLSHRECDSLRHIRIRFTPMDTFNGKVHSNDTISIAAYSDRPVFLERVTTSANYISPPYNSALYRKGWGYRAPVDFSDNLDEIQRHAGYSWGTQGSDSLTQLVLSGNLIRMRKCGLRRINGVDSMACYPLTINSAEAVPAPVTGVVFVDGKVWVSASRGIVDLMDGEVPQRDPADGGFISEGFSGCLTIAATDTIIITDNLVYQGALRNFRVPTTMDSCSDILGLVSERYIMVGKDVRDNVYIHAAMAALGGSISVQDIYMNRAPGWDNEKGTLSIYGSMAQRNRGLIHTADYPPGHTRGFRAKDYHYDIRLARLAPPHFPRLSDGSFFAVAVDQ